MLTYANKKLTNIAPADWHLIFNEIEPPGLETYIGKTNLIFFRNVN